MPGGDGTGPNGLGTQTGRALGYCVGSDSPGYVRGPGRSVARGFGRGVDPRYSRGMARGRCGNWGLGRDRYIGGGRGGIFYPTPLYPNPIEVTPEQRLTTLKQDKEYLVSQLKTLQNSIEAVSKKIEELDINE